VNENERAVLEAKDADANDAAEPYVKRVAEANAQAPIAFAKELVAGKRRVFHSPAELDCEGAVACRAPSPPPTS
jgi:hypothetical protein